MTESHKLETLVNFARLERYTPAQLHRAADLLERGIPTLADLLAGLPGAPDVPKIDYPEAYRYLLRGRAGAGEAPPVRGFGDRPYTDLTAGAVSAAAQGIQAIVAERRRLDGRVRAAPDDRAHGSAAAEHNVLTARSVARALADAGWFTGDPLARLPTPKRPGGGRENSLTNQEACDYLGALLEESADPLFDALTFCLISATAARPVEALGIAEASLTAQRPSVLLVGKGGPIREQPVARPLVEAVLELSATRPGDPTRHALRGRRGGPLAGGRFGFWSQWLHAHAAWARGHDIGPYALRHTPARAVGARFGHHSLPASLFLGHSLKHDLSTAATYLHSPYTDEWSLRRLVAERTFGALEAWPELPENRVLRRFLPGPWSV